METPIHNVLRDVTQIDKSARSVFRVPGVATQAKNNADRVVTPLCRGKRRRVSGSTHLLCATALLLDGAFTFK